MKIIRFYKEGLIRYGVIESGETVREVSGSIYEHFELSDNIYNLKEINLLAPCQPSKIICVGLNYKAHIDEFKRDNFEEPEEPVLFMKPPTAVIGPEGSIIYPNMSSRVDFEAELAVVIGKTAVDIGPEEVYGHILGYTCANDVTARDLQRKDGQWTRAKGFDTFAPLGPWIETELNPENIRIRLYLNDSLKQDSSTGNMIFPVPRLVSFISRVMTLTPGDVIMTGTPEGVGPMMVGDTVKVTVDGIGSLTNRISLKNP